MWKKIAIAGAIAAAAVGTGTAALAASGSSSTAGTPAPASTSTPAPSTTGNGASTDPAKHRARVAARRALHGQWVSGKKGSTTFVTHDAIKGSVTAVSASSITIKAADNTSQTYTVSSATKVRARTAGKGAASTIGAVKLGDTVGVVGTGAGSGPYAATGIVDVHK